MNKATRALSILLIPVLINLLHSCCTCGDNFLPFEFNKLQIELLDNTRGWPTPAGDDTLFSDAVAFTLNLSDSVMDHSWYAQTAPFTLIKTVNAMECDCEPEYLPNHKITALNIITLYDISPDIPANSNVTDHFVAEHSYFQNENLYMSLPEVLGIISSFETLSMPGQTIHLFLTLSVKNDVAEFEVSITLANGSILKKRTGMIQIVN